MNVKFLREIDFKFFNKTSFKNFLTICKYSWRLILLFVLPVLFIPIIAVNNTVISRAAYLCILMATFWMFELLPLPVTALFPVLLSPLFGITDTDVISRIYMKGTIMMFVGGLLVAVAVEHCNLHRRIALRVLLCVRKGAHWLMLGFMLTTMFLSMWISNTATTAMMVPIIDAIIQQLTKKFSTPEHIPIPEISKNPSDLSISQSVSIEEKKEENASKKDEVVEGSVEVTEDTKFSRMRLAFLLSVAYSANCGGTGSLTGTGPNLVLKGLLDEQEGSNEITFATWMMYNVPGMLICVFAAWIFLVLFVMRHSFFKKERTEESNTVRETLRRQYEELGRISFHEAAVLCLFFILVILWLFRDPKFIPGWVEITDKSVDVNDATPAIGIAILLFLIPARPLEFGKSPPLLDWKTAQLKLPWGIIVLIGGGFALAECAKVSKLSRWIGDQLTYFEYLPVEGTIILLCIFTAMLTEVVSNSATASIVLPVIKQLALAIRINPLYLMLPATIACSYAFMLPVATPPNAIAYDAGRMKIRQMLVPGLAMNIICCLVQFFMITTLGKAIFNLGTFPEWAVAEAMKLNLTNIHSSNSTSIT